MVPIRIQLRGSISAWAQAVNSLSGWSSCLFAMWRTLDFHLATIRSSKPGMVDCALPYKWLRTAFSHSWIISHPFSLLAFLSFLLILLFTCQMSLKCCVSFSLVLIHFATPLCRSLIKMSILRPDFLRNSKYLFAPSSSIALLLPHSFAYVYLKI